MSVKVIHIKNAPKDWQSNLDYVYIGRSGKGLNGFFGNPHTVGHCKLCNHVHAQGEAVKEFEKYFEDKIVSDENFRIAVFQLSGKTLVCFCKSTPDIACHGDVYVEFLQKYFV